MSAPPSPGWVHATAPNRTVQAASGVTYAYRRFGKAVHRAPPLLLLPHLGSNLDGWDPALVDALAAGREVILFDNAGIAGSGGVTPRTVAAMAHDALVLVDALGLRAIDVLGFSLGGCVAQEIALARPHVVRRSVLASTGPEGGVGLHGFTPEVRAATMADEPTIAQLLHLFFAQTTESIDRGWEFVERLVARTGDRDEPVSPRAREAQLDALLTWGTPDPTRHDRLAGIRQPTLVAGGDSDIVIPAPSSQLLAECIADARLSIYPGAGHGFLFQYPETFAAEVNAFLG